MGSGLSMSKKQEIIAIAEKKKEFGKQIKLSNVTELLTQLGVIDDPKAKKFLNNFMETDTPQERTYLPTAEYVTQQALIMAGSKTLFKDPEDNILNTVGNSLAKAWGSYKGFKSEKVVEMTKGHTDFGQLTINNPTTSQEETQKKSRFARSKKNEFGDKIE